MLSIEDIWVNVCPILPDNRTEFLVHSNRAKQFRVLTQRLEDWPTQKRFKIDNLLLAVRELKLDLKSLQWFG